MTSPDQRGSIFFERFRAEVARYADGVHRLGDPARPAALKGLPAELASFLRSFDGADLFVDALTIRDAAHVAREGELVVFGETATGDRLALDPGGRVLRLEEDTGEALVEGTSFARWIEALVVADGVLYDREGDFREGLFDEDSDELTPAAAEKRERKALKLDPDAPAPAWRLARALERSGRAAEAEKLLRRAVAGDPDFGWAWFDLAKLARAAGRLEDAEAAFARAAECGGDHAGFFAAHAARAAAERGDDAARARHAARAVELDPLVTQAQRRAAASRLEEGAREEAKEHVALAAAVAPRDLDVLALRKKLQQRGG